MYSQAQKSLKLPELKESQNPSYITYTAQQEMNLPQENKRKNVPMSRKIM
jgi:hypothetical protein